MQVMLTKSRRVYCVGGAVTSTGVNAAIRAEISSHLECIDNHGA